MASRTHLRDTLGAPALVALMTLVYAGCADKTESPTADPQLRNQALHIEMRDGVRIAIDVWLPDTVRAGARVPTLMRMTRYWRAMDVAGADEDVARSSDYGRAEMVNGAGYAYVTVDARGTGASFGTRAYETTQDEVKDYGEIADWIAGQSWSNGRVGSFGVSYEGTTAEMIAVNGRPSVRAVAPLYPDFNAYDHLAYPGNVFLEFFTDAWGHAVLMMDQNDICGLQGAEGEACDQLKLQVRGVNPVDADVDGSLLEAAVAEHALNVRVADAARSVEFRDDAFGPGPANVGELSAPGYHLEELAVSGVAYFTRVGWLDGATVNGALSRFNSLPNRQRVVIGALSHGGGHDADPFRPIDASPDPSTEEQSANLIAFFNTFLKEDGSETMESEVHYVTLGSGEWHTTTSWPPEGFDDTVFYFAPDGRLSRTEPGAGGVDEYAVDFTTTTGRTTRWHTQMGGGDVVYGDRAEADEKLLTYTSDPLPRDAEITGHPLVTLYVRSTATDGALFVYLEDVAPDGRVTYITEGQLRAISRKIADREPPYHHYGPYRTFKREDAVELVPGEVAELSFDLWAISALIREGHRIRVAIAGADDGIFARYPRDGSVPVITVERTAEHPSRIVLPMAER
jgi:putative CocE/NonD family hydrolase